LDSNLLIASNAIYNVCTNVSDCGAIYTNDYAHASSGIAITNNVVGGFGGSSLNSKGIYLDDMASNTTVTNNIIYGAGTYGLQIHGGNNDTIQNNVFDISTDTKLGLYQSETGTMASNVFTCNVIYSSASAKPVSLWDYLGSGILPSDSKNIYWASAGALPNIGAIVDSQPLVANPNFVSPSTGNYTTNLANPGFCGYQAISTATVGPLVN